MVGVLLELVKAARERGARLTIGIWSAWLREETGGVMICGVDGVASNV